MYNSALFTALALSPASKAVTTCRKSFARQSPAAKRPCAFVRIFSSVTIKPVLSGVSTKPLKILHMADDPQNEIPSADISERPPAPNIFHFYTSDKRLFPVISGTVEFPDKLNLRQRHDSAACPPREACPSGESQPLFTKWVRKSAS